MGIVVFLLYPFLVLFFKISGNVHIDMDELFWSLKNTSLQAFLSALFSLLFGFFLSLGVLSYQNFNKYRTSLDLFFLLPSFIPNLFIIIALMNLIDPFPIGMIGIIIAHVVINTGIVAIFLKNNIQLKLGISGELALVMGSSRMRFLTKILIPQLKKDFFEIFFFVFCICFSSFSIPMVIGGGRGVNLEILIYEKIRIYSDWSSGVIIATLQSLILFAFSFLTFKSQKYQSKQNFNFQIISSKSVLLFFFIIYLLFLASFFRGLFEGTGLSSDFYLFKSELFSALVGTLILSTVVGLCVFGYLILLSYVWNNNMFAKFLQGYLTPSSALVALSLLIVGPNTGIFVFLKISIALLILYSSLAYRLGWNSLLYELEAEKEKALILGASENLIFKKIVIPLVLRKAFFISGLCAFWTSGEFAISKILAQSDFTLAMVTETFISQYRLSIASWLTLVVLCLGVLIFYIFIEVGRVLSQKIEDSL